MKRSKSIKRDVGRIEKREDSLDQMLEKLNERQLKLDTIRSEINEHTAALENERKSLQDQRTALTSRLEEVSGMSIGEAKEQLLDVVRLDTQHDASELVKEIIEEATVKKAKARAAKLHCKRFSGMHLIMFQKRL